ncbi:hypothetical protein QOZ80_5AG0398300 [Eleusine coracana subsp. coracana]|nr:hypothetical protein QOZ80_5AG0398300 [Eleusine coracana subsp. coracana]
MRRRSSSPSLLAQSLRRLLLPLRAPPMGFLICAFLLQLLFLGPSSPATAQSQPLSPVRVLDATLQNYAYRALVPPRTGIVFNATLPGNLTGIAVSAARLRTGSLRRKGFNGYFEFDIPTGVTVQPFVERLVLVYHNLGNWSDYYYPIPGYTYLAPVLGLLVYDASDLSAVGLQEQNIIVTESPILVIFSNVREVPSGGPAPRCVYFDLNGMPWFSDLNRTNVCSTYRQGHFSIVVNSSAIPPAPAPAPSGAIAPPIPPAGSHAKKGNTKTWKIAGTAVGAALALVLLASLMICLVRHKRHKKLEMMKQNAEVGETFRMAQVGRTQAPVASGTRTQPVIESNYVP